MFGVVGHFVDAFLPANYLNLAKVVQTHCETVKHLLQLPVFAHHFSVFIEGDVAAGVDEIGIGYLFGGTQVDADTNYIVYAIGGTLNDLLPACHYGAVVGLVGEAFVGSEGEGGVEIVVAEAYPYC